MNIQEITKRLNFIEQIKFDYEAAHAEEQQLYSDVMEYIANGGKNGQKLIKEALKAKEIEFPRYTA